METPTYEVIHEDDDYRLSLEWTYEDKRVPLVHIQLRKWTPRVLRKLYVQRAKLIEQLKERGCPYALAANPNEDSKWRKFMDVVGFKYLTAHDGMSVYLLEFE